MSAFPDISEIRRELIAFRTANAGDPALCHRVSSAICQLEQLQRATDPAHKRRLRAEIARTMREIERVKRDGCFVHQGLGGYRGAA